MERERVKSLKAKCRRKGGYNVPDVTINDFANAADVKKGRIKKKGFGNFVESVQGLSITDVPNDWNEEEEIGGICWKSKIACSPRKVVSTSSIRTSGKIYPLDVWFLISQHIRPQDISRFSAICKNAYTVVNAPSFWFNLYKRYCQDKQKLPERLYPECMTRLYSLKPCVIRALHYTYPPLAARCQINETKSNLMKYHPQYLPYIWDKYLLKKKCTLLWWNLVDDMYEFNFKLKRETSDHAKNVGKDLQEILDDISANKEDGCLLLQVTVKHFMPTPSVFGLTLTSINNNPNSLKLMFSTGVMPSCYRMPSNTAVTITFKDVTKIYAHDWWSPHYPHSDKLLC